MAEGLSRTHLHLDVVMPAKPMLSLFGWLKSEQRLHGLPPKGRFIAIEAFECTTAEVLETQETVRQLAVGIDQIIWHAVEAVGLLRGGSRPAIRP